MEEIGTKNELEPIQYRYNIHATQLLYLLVKTPAVKPSKCIQKLPCFTRGVYRSEYSYSVKRKFTIYLKVCTIDGYSSVWTGKCYN